MSIYASFDNLTGQQIASNQGWSDFGHWVDSLDADKYGELVSLWEYGWSQEIAAVASELTSALQASTPAESVVGSAKLLLAALHSNSQAEAVFVNDGMVADAQPNKQ